ncbi:hypothetical protein JCM10207_002152 [Rhodosporidiobolus poonsookiae]
MLSLALPSAPAALAAAALASPSASASASLSPSSPPSRPLAHPARGITSPLTVPSAFSALWTAFLVASPSRTDKALFTRWRAVPQAVFKAAFAAEDGEVDELRKMRMGKKWEGLCERVGRGEVGGPGELDLHTLPLLSHLYSTSYLTVLELLRRVELAHPSSSRVKNWAKELRRWSRGEWVVMTTTARRGVVGELEGVLGSAGGASEDLEVFSAAPLYAALPFLAAAHASYVASESGAAGLIAPTSHRSPSPSCSLAALSTTPAPPPPFLSLRSLSSSLPALSSSSSSSLSLPTSPTNSSSSTPTKKRRRRSSLPGDWVDPPLWAETDADADTWVSVGGDGGGGGGREGGEGEGEGEVVGPARPVRRRRTA